MKIQKGKKSKLHTLSQKKIKTALHEEKEAIRDYRKDAKSVDKVTAKVFRHIAKDEVHHKKELIKLQK